MDTKQKQKLFVHKIADFLLIECALVKLVRLEHSNLMAIIRNNFDNFLVDYVIIELAVHFVCF